jgi:hypothetical protein
MLELITIILLNLGLHISSNSSIASINSSTETSINNNDDTTSPGDIVITDDDNPFEIGSK